MHAPNLRNFDFCLRQKRVSLCLTNSILKGLAITCSLCDLQQLWIPGAEAANCQMWDVWPDPLY